jgi:hypothetical protein
VEVSGQIHVPAALPRKESDKKPERPPNRSKRYREEINCFPLPIFLGCPALSPLSEFNCATQVAYNVNSNVNMLGVQNYEVESAITPLASGSFCGVR